MSCTSHKHSTIHIAQGPLLKHTPSDDAEHVMQPKQEVQAQRTFSFVQRSSRVTPRASIACST